MSRVIFLLVLPVLFLGACRQDPQPAAQPPLSLLPVRLEQGNQVTELVYDNQHRLMEVNYTSHYPGGTMTSFQKFSYNAEGLISSLVTDQDFRFIYFYDNKKIIKTDEYIGDHLTQSHTFSYDNNDRVKESITLQNIPEEGGIIPVAKSTYTYDSDGNLIQNKLYYYSTGGTNETLLTTLTFSGYDKYLNSEMHFERVAINPAHLAFKNNPAKLEVRNQNGILVSTEYYSYSYNVHGYAVSKTTVVKALSGDETYETKYFFD